MIGDKMNKSITHKEQKELFDSLELFGGVEVARLLGWNKSKVSVYMKRGILPQPIGLIGNRPFWTKQQIEKFIKGGSGK